MKKNISYSPEEIKTFLKEALTEHEKERAGLEGEKLYSKNAARKVLGNRAHITITRMIQKGLLKTTPDGRIPQSEIDRYLSTL